MCSVVNSYHGFNSPHKKNGVTDQNCHTDFHLVKLINSIVFIFLFFLQLFRHTADTDYSYSLVKVYKCS